MNKIHYNNSLRGSSLVDYAMQGSHIYLVHDFPDFPRPKTLISPDSERALPYLPGTNAGILPKLWN